MTTPTNRLLAPAALLLAAALTTGCGHTHHQTVTPRCSRVTTNPHGDYVASGRRPCILTTRPPQDTRPMTRTNKPEPAPVTHHTPAKPTPAPRTAAKLAKPHPAPTAHKKTTKPNTARSRR